MKIVKKFRVSVLLIILSTFLACSYDQSNLTQEFYENGQLKSEGAMKDGVRQDEWIFISPKGDTSEVVNYQNGKAKVKDVYSENSVLRKVEYLEESNRTVTTIYYPSGEVQCKIQGIDEVFDGLGICYYENGALQSEITYKDGEFEGEFKEYHPNGNVFVTAENYGNGLYEIYDTLGVFRMGVLFKNHIPVDTLFKEETKRKSKPNH